MSEYFSHDYDTRNDEKIIALLAEMGWEGYGLYWGLVELLYQNDGYMLMQCGRIAYALRTKQEKVKQVIEDFELFVIDGDKFYSNSVLNRLEQRNEKSEKARQSALKRWENANAMRTHSDGNAIKESKVKESKEKKEYIESNSKKCLMKNSGITVSEVIESFSKSNDLVNADAKYYYNLALDWSDAKGEMRKDWVAVVRTFARRAISDGKLKLKNTVTANPTNVAKSVPADFGKVSPNAMTLEEYRKMKEHEKSI